MTAQAATWVRSFVVARSVAEAVELRQDLGAGAAFLAGGTDLGVVMRRRAATPEHLIDVSRIEELRAIEEVGPDIVIGAGVTHRAIERAPLLSLHARALQEACATVGSIQTRTVGTIGGNLCNASPAADTAPVLMSLAASVEIAGPDGRRTVGLEEFFTAYRTTALGPADLLVSVRIPAAPSRRGSAFIKLGRRAAMEISIACAAVRLDLDDSGTIESAGVGLGSVGPVPLHSESSEAVLAGATPGDTTWSEAGQAAARDCSPIDDVRASASYRRSMVPVIVARASAVAAERAAS
jgi:carbon-monoxide dehydrogenase medium subunit